VIRYDKSSESLHSWRVHAAKQHTSSDSESLPSYGSAAVQAPVAAELSSRLCSYGSHHWCTHTTMCSVGITGIGGTKTTASIGSIIRELCVLCSGAFAAVYSAACTTYSALLTVCSLCVLVRCDHCVCSMRMCT
jgi:hypothetical protein